MGLFFMSQRPEDDNVKRESPSTSKYVPPHLRKKMLAAGSPSSSRGSSPSTSRDKESPWSSNSTDSRTSHSPSRDWSSNGRSNSSSSSSRRGWNSRPRWDEPNSRLEQELFGNQVSSGINFEKYEAIPVEVSGRDCPSSVFDNFSDAPLGKILTRNIDLAGYKQPTPIQKNSLPIVLAGRDLMACAQTGSGKTAAFLFPTLSKLCNDFPDGIEDPPYASGYGRRNRKVYPSVLVMAPTRELAQQIHLEARKFSYRSPFRCCVAYGGADIGSQLRSMEQGCDILIATPGRIIDMIERGRVSLSQIRFFIMDEADRMLDMGFEPQIRQIVEDEDMPQGDERQTLMFSATFPKEIQKLAQDFLQDYIFLQVGRVGSTTDSITQRVIQVDERDKKEALVDLLDQIQGLTLIFVETKRNCDFIEDYLYDLGYPVVAIHGDRNQREREAALNSFRSEKTPILVATDVAARGLDIDNVLHVINFDLPHDINDYVHRIGRTGRAGHAGVATAMINEKNSNLIKDLVEILHEASQDVPDWLNSMSRNAARGKGRTQTRDYRPSGGRRGGSGGGAGGSGGSSRYGAPRSSNFGGGAW